MTKEFIILLYEADGRCPICMQPMDLEPLKEYVKGKQKISLKKINKILGFDIDVDHVIPKSHGGKNSIRNKQITHKKCNHKTGNYKGIIHPVLTPWILD